MSEPIFESGLAVYAGANLLRRSTTQFLQYLFGEIQYCQPYQWSADKNATNINILAQYPLADMVYPTIIVSSVRPDTRPLFIGEVSYNGDFSVVTGDQTPTTGIVTGYGVSYTVQHIYDITLRIVDINPNSVEMISDRLMLLLAVRKYRDQFTIQYGVFVDPSTVFRSSDFTIMPLPGTKANEYSLTLSFRVFWQGEVIFPEDVDTIVSESVTDEQIDP